MTQWEEFVFARPEALWGLVLLPFLVALFLAAERQRKRALGAFLSPRLQPRLAGSASVSRRRWSFFLVLIGLALSLLAVAQPRWGFTWDERTSRGRDIIIAIDTSRSMLAQDLKPNRITRAKLAAQDLLESLDGDRVGLVAFAGTAFLQAPLTADYDAVRNSLAEIDTEIIPRGGTNLTAAIEAAQDAFGKGESEHRALIIFTDGEELEADAVEAARLAAAKFRIFTVGMGSSQGALIPFANERGGTDFVRDDKGQYVTSRLDEARLREIAEAGEGFYVQLQSGPPEMQQIVREGLGKMKERESESRFVKQPIERYQWPLASAVVCFVVSLLIGESRRRSAKMAVAIMVAGWMSGVPVHAEPPELLYNRGCEAFQNGDFKTAAQAFSDALGGADGPLQTKAAFNLANTLARRGAGLETPAEKLAEWKNALQHYDRVLQIDPQHADARHNRDLVAKAMEDLQKQQEEQKKQEQSEQKNEDEKKDEQKQDQQGSSGQQQEQKEGKQDKQPQSQEGGKQQEPQKQNPGEDERGEGEQKKEKGENEQPETKPGEKGDDEEKKQSPQNQDGSPQDPNEKPKEGELKAAEPREEGAPGDGEAPSPEDLAAMKEGRMTARDAKLLLDAMKKFDERVRLLNPREAQRERPAPGFKNW